MDRHEIWPQNGGDRGVVRYPDPAIEELDPRFAKYRLGSTQVEQLATGIAGPKARSGLAMAATWSGAISLITG